MRTHSKRKEEQSLC
jgi:hypothetical protein